MAKPRNVSEILTELFGLELKSEITESVLSQNRLATVAKIAPQSISDYRRGISVPTRTSLGKIIAALEKFHISSYPNIPEDLITELQTTITHGYNPVTGFLRLALSDPNVVHKETGEQLTPHVFAKEMEVTDSAIHALLRKPDNSTLRVETLDRIRATWNTLLQNYPRLSNYTTWRIIQAPNPAPKAHTTPTPKAPPAKLPPPPESSIPKLALKKLQDLLLNRNNWITSKRTGNTLSMNNLAIATSIRPPTLTNTYKRPFGYLTPEMSRNLRTGLKELANNYDNFPAHQVEAILEGTDRSLTTRRR